MSDDLHVSPERTLSWIRTAQLSPRVNISSLPRHALLEIFKFYVDQIDHADDWHTLVHVCREWRDIVFSSPRWLCLELRCTNKSPVKRLLDVWPALPIVIDALTTKSRRSGVANIMAALKRHDLVCRIKIWRVPNSLLKSAAIKKRFPQLTDLTLRSNKANAPVIPDSFLGGSAPRLRLLDFKGITFLFPALKKLLLSAAGLVTFRLWDIPNSGIISSELFVTSLSTLTRLRELFIGFRSPRSRADRERRHPTLFKRLVLPSLTEFYFKGDSEYLEDIVGRMDAPALERVAITFFNQLVFDTPLLCDFFSRTEVFQEPRRADVTLARSCVKFTLSYPEGVADRRMLEVGISSSVLEWQLSSLAQFCNTSLPPLPTLECLGIHTNFPMGPESTDGIESALWLELLNSFITVKDLVLFGSLIQYAAPALREITGEGGPKVLPALRHIFLGWFQINPSAREAIAQIVTARQLCGHPVSLNPTETDRSW